MGFTPVKVIALGLSEQILALLEFAWDSTDFQITAVSDTNPETAAGVARRYECQAFDDFRQLIIQSHGDLLLVGCPIHQCAEQIRLAIEKKYHILKILPAGLHFEQAAEWIQGARRNKRKFMVIQEGRYDPLLGSMRHMLKEAETNYWHLITAVCHVPAPPLEAHNRWRYDPTLAGGGIMLQDSYPLIDEMVMCFGLPQQVYAQVTNQAPDRAQRLSLNEDTALVMMRFSDTLMAQVCGSRTLGPARKHLRVHGKDKVVTLIPGELTVFDHNGLLLETEQFDLTQSRWAEELMRAFVPKNEIRPDWPANLDLLTMAVLESAYLSARTGMPEEPARMLNLAGISQTRLW